MPAPDAVGCAVLDGVRAGVPDGSLLEAAEAAATGVKTTVMGTRLSDVVVVCPSTTKASNVAAADCACDCDCTCAACVEACAACDVTEGSAEATEASTRDCGERDEVDAAKVVVLE